MSESKHADDGNASVVVDVTAVEISPNPCALTDELNLEVDFYLDQPVDNGVWDVQYLVDSVTKRHIITLGQVPAQDYPAGDNHFQFSTPYVDVTGIEPSQLTNCGLLIASFKSDLGDILDLKMVVQVDQQRSGLQRVIYNPLE